MIVELRAKLAEKDKQIADLTAAARDQMIHQREEMVLLKSLHRGGFSMQTARNWIKAEKVEGEQRGARGDYFAVPSSFEAYLRSLGARFRQKP